MNLFVSLPLTILLLSGAAVFALVPPSHNVKGNIHLVIEDVDISFEGWYDPENHRSRVDFFDSATKTYHLPNQGSKTRFYKIVPASDGEKNLTKCFYRSFDKESFQPTIPINIDRGNKTKGRINGIPYTLYTHIRVHEEKVFTLQKYWVHENGSSEIPIRYEVKVYSLLHVLNHYFIGYYDYKEGLIPSEIFTVDPKLSCTLGARSLGKVVNPMQSYVDLEDDAFRAEAIRLNFEFINKMNNAGMDYKLGINKFIDWTHEEYLALLSSKPLSSPIDNEREPYPSKNDRVPAQLPGELDLRKQGFVTPVKDMLATCGSAYAFSAVGALEGAYYKKHKILITLSTQAIVDCTWDESAIRNRGCDRGFQGDAIDMVIRHGVPANSQYYQRYSGIENYCVLSNQAFILKAKELRPVQANSIDALKQALVEHGPVAVEIDTSPPTFSAYSSGVYTDPKCRSKVSSYREALVVGYGVQDGKPYWLIKNSFGTTWGEQGYIKISQKDNLCGVLDKPVYAILD